MKPTLRPPGVTLQEMQTTKSLTPIEIGWNSGKGGGIRGFHAADSRVLLDLALKLNHAHTLRSVTDAISDYCGKALGIPAGMIFVERNRDLHLTSWWPRRTNSTRQLPQELMTKGPVARTFRTGEPMFWNRKHSYPSAALRSLCREFVRSQDRSIAFLPIGASGESPIGVLALVLPRATEFALDTRDRLLLFARMISGCIMRARAYDEAIAARTGAEDAMQRKDEFLSVMSHELKNPMTPILNWALALNSGTLPADKQNLAIDAIVRNVRALNYLIDDLFDASRIASGKLRLQPSEIRIQEVARDVMASVQPAVEAKKLRMSTDIEEGIAPFLADARRLRQVLTNLLNNAIKFTPSGGSVSLRIRKHDGSVECLVSDTGKGIEQKFLPFVFDKFSQESACGRGSAVGLGLGLAIVREIVRLHGGSIKASSGGRDRGATFLVRLPMRTRKKTRNHRK
jgi:signal transduction histidine kinase